MQFTEHDDFLVSLQNAPIGICILDAISFVAEMVNEKFLAVAGKPYDAIFGKFYWDAFAEGRPYYAAALSNVAKTGEAFYADEVELTLIRHGEPENIFVTFVYAPVKNKKGAVSKIVVWVLENTTQVRARQAVEKAASQANNTVEVLRNMILQAPVAMCLLTGPNHEIDIANDLIIQLWGKERAAVMGKPVFDALPDARGQGLEEYMQKVYHYGQTFSASEMPVTLTRGGKSEVIYQNFVYEPYRDSNNNIKGIIAITTDVTAMVLAREEQARINKELKQANEMIRNIIQQAPVAMGLFRGYDMVVEEINDAFLELWQRDRSVVGKPVLEALPELQDQPYPEIMREVFRTGTTYYGNESEVYLHRQDKLSAGYFNFINQAFRNSEGEILGIVVVATEVTEQVKARREIERAYEQARLSKEAARLGTFDLDLVLGTMEWDDRCRVLFGINHKDPVTYEKDFLTGLHPDDRERVIAVIKDVFDRSVSQGVYDIEYRTIGAQDQKLRWVRAKGQAYFDDSDRPVRFIGSVLEITEQKDDEHRKNDFIGMVSHELKTPLTSLTALLQVAQRKMEKSDDQFLNSAMEKANLQVKKMTAMINGFLNISRLESGKLHLQLQDFQLDKLINEAIEETLITASNHHINLLPCEPVLVCADREKLSHVISNLLHNAAKYSPKGNEILVKCELEGDSARVSIKDKGIGIKQADLANLFERYYRVQNQHTQHISGFGVGLYLSAEIVKAHNGKIWAESELGEGSTFYFTVPVGACPIPGLS